MGEIPTIDELRVTRYEEPIRVGGRPAQGKSKYDKRQTWYDLPEALLERFAAFLSDEDYLSLAKEIALLRTFLDGMLKTMKHWEELANEAMERGELPPKPPITYSQLLAAIDNVGKMVQRESQILNSDSNTITLESAMTFAVAVADTVNRYVKDPKVQEAIYTEIRRLLTAGRTFTLSMEVARRILTPTIEEDTPSKEDEEANIADK